MDSHADQPSLSPASVNNPLSASAFNKSASSLGTSAAASFTAMPLATAGTQGGSGSAPTSSQGDEHRQHHHHHHEQSINDENSESSPYCTFSAEELAQTLEQYEKSGSKNRPLFEEYFVSGQMPPRCKKCNRLIASHRESSVESGMDNNNDNKNRSNHQQEKDKDSQNNGGDDRVSIFTPVTSIAVTSKPQQHQQSAKGGNNNNKVTINTDLDSFLDRDALANSQNHKNNGNSSSSSSKNRDFLANLIIYPYDDQEIVNLPDQYSKFLRLPAFIVCSVIVTIATLMATLFIVFKIMDILNEKKPLHERWLPALGPVLLVLVGFLLSFLPEKIYITFDKRAKEICYMRYRLLWWCLSRTAVVKFRHVIAIETRETRDQNGVKYDEVVLKSSKVRDSPLLAVSMMHSNTNEGITMSASSNVFPVGGDSKIEDNTSTPQQQQLQHSPSQQLSPSPSGVHRTDSNSLGKSTRRELPLNFSEAAEKQAAAARKPYHKQMQMELEEDQDVEDKEFVIDVVEESESEACRASWIYYLRSIGVQI